jgi:opine dehydrogenase
MSAGPPTVAVIGAGNVGSALAADLVLRGVDVRLWNGSPGRLEAIRRAGGITATGAVEGFAPLALLTASLEEAVRGAHIIAITLPTPALPSLTPALADVITIDQLLWLNPGHSGGALYVAAEMARRTGRRARRLCQLSTASHGCRMSDPATVGVFHTPAARLAAFPGTAVDECLERIDALLPGQFTPADTVLELDLGNINGVLHPPLMVCNAGWIEASAGKFPIYRDGAGPAVARLIEAIDAERMALADRLDVPTGTLSDFLRDAGYTTAAAAATGRVHDALQGSEAVAAVQAPATLDHRYLHEDVGWGLVPWLELARHSDRRVPAMEAVTTLAGTLNGVDYRRHGLTLERMGLAGVNPDAIVAYARRGELRSSA